MIQELKYKLQDLGVTPLSFSKINKMFHCPYQYKRKYIDGDRIKDPLTGKAPRGEVKQVVGSFVHKVLENCINQGALIGYSNIDFLLVWAKTLQSSKLLTKEIEEANTFKENTEKVLDRVILSIKENNLKPFPELWFNNWVDPERPQSYIKNMKDSKNNDKFLQGSCDLVLISQNGWGQRGIIIDYKSYPEEAHPGDIYAYMQLVLYCYIVFSGFKNLDSIKCITVDVSSNKFTTTRIIQKGELSKEIDHIIKFLQSYADLIIQYKDGVYPRTKNDFCKYCDYQLICARDDSKFDRFKNA